MTNSAAADCGWPHEVSEFPASRPVFEGGGAITCLSPVSLLCDAEAVGLWKFFFYSFSSQKPCLEHGTPDQSILTWSWLLSQVAACLVKNSSQYFPARKGGWGCWPGAQNASTMPQETLEKKWQPAPVFCLETCMVEEPGELPSMGLQGVGHNWATEHTHMAYTNQPVL